MKRQPPQHPTKQGCQCRYANDGRFQGAGMTIPYADTPRNLK